MRVVPPHGSISQMQIATNVKSPVPHPFLPVTLRVNVDIPFAMGEEAEAQRQSHLPTT